MDYCKALKFDEIPDYARMHGIVQGMITKECVNSNGLFDWILEAAVRL